MGVVYIHLGKQRKVWCFKGLRRGDPLSRFLFTLADVWSRLLENANKMKLIEGLVVGRERVEVCLQYTDDTIFSCALIQAKLIQSSVNVRCGNGVCLI